MINNEGMESTRTVQEVQTTENREMTGAGATPTNIVENKAPQTPLQRQTTQNVTQKPKPQTLYHTKIKEHFNIYGVATFLYACWYAFCMYRNPSGVTYSFFVAGSLVYICFCLSKLGITWKKGNGFYAVSMVLLSVSTFCTDDGRIIFFNKLGVFLLTISMVLGIAYQTGKWNLGKYLIAILTTCAGILGELGAPFSDAIWYCKNKLDKKNKKYIYVGIGLLVTIPLFLIVLALLTSADIVFRNMADKVLSGFRFGNIMLVIWMVALMFFVSYGILVQHSKKCIPEEVKDKRNGEPLIAIPVATVLSLLYIVFSGVQILYLFMGNMELPTGYTYAEYAREGFFQLLAVGILNLILVLIGLCYFRPNKLLKIILTVMSACTFVMLASSAVRMIIYIQFYYLTFLRILVLWSLVVLFLIFTGVIIYIFKDRFPLFRYSMVVVTVLYIGLSFSHPDYWIAKVNLEGSKETRSEFFLGRQYSDFRFLKNLSADAAPVLLEWAEEEGCDLWYYTYCNDSEKYVEYLSEFRKYNPAAVNNDGSAKSYAYDYLENLAERVGKTTLRNFNVSRVVADRMAVGKTEGGI